MTTKKKREEERKHMEPPPEAGEMLSGRREFIFIKET